MSSRLTHFRSIRSQSRVIVTSTQPRRTYPAPIDEFIDRRAPIYKVLAHTKVFIAPERRFPSVNQCFIQVQKEQFAIRAAGGHLSMLYPQMSSLQAGQSFKGRTFQLERPTLAGCQSVSQFSREPARCKREGHDGSSKNAFPLKPR